MFSEIENGLRTLTAVARKMVNRSGVRGVSRWKSVCEKGRDAGRSAASVEIMKAMENTGFAARVLGDPSEDVWNEV